MAFRISISSRGRTPRAFKPATTSDSDDSALTSAKPIPGSWVICASVRGTTIVSPRAQGKIKADLLRIVDEQRGSSISQYFTLAGMKVDPEKLTSEVTGTLHTVVGSKSVTAEPKTFRFYWAYRGLTLQLKGFGMVTKDDAANGGDA